MTGLVIGWSWPRFLVAFGVSLPLLIMVVEVARWVGERLADLALGLGRRVIRTPTPKEDL